ncbi:hypothetical protein SASPL_137876 [Salvia splendens]|uniref:Zinc finger BED domain-containing protein RICESLEEPER n=1 Tax=Salvia splendens TaxID=180675 RepID=A0A8X8WU63_SALSN|nr:hypothetical protein SASPL_137876 [Salvia splendens]
MPRGGHTRRRTSSSIDTPLDAELLADAAEEPNNIEGEQDIVGFSQDVGSNQPNLDMLEDIEVEQLGLKGIKKRKHVVRSDIWKEFDRVIEDSIQKGKCKRCKKLIAADPKNNGTSAMMIILDEQPFRCVEHEGFRLFCCDMLLNFKIPSKYTIRSKCVKMFLKERELLKVVFSGPGMAIKEMKSTFNARGMLVANGQYFHQRCVAHVLNLVVEDNMKQIDMVVVRVREAVKWIKGSWSKAFKDIVNVALLYEPAMKRFSNVTPQFGRDFGFEKPETQRPLAYLEKKIGLN